MSEEFKRGIKLTPEEMRQPLRRPLSELIDSPPPAVKPLGDEWQCECGCRQRAFIDEQQPNGHYAPGSSFRCVNCKRETIAKPPSDLAAALQTMLMEYSALGVLLDKTRKEAAEVLRQHAAQPVEGTLINEINPPGSYEKYLTQLARAGKAEADLARLCAEVDRKNAAIRNAIQCFGDDEGESAQQMVADLEDVLSVAKEEPND